MADISTGDPDGQMVSTLRRVADWLRHAPISSGVCCCGDEISSHSTIANHHPVDQAEYDALNLVEEIEAVLAAHEKGRGLVPQPNADLSKCLRDLSGADQSSQ